MSEHTMLRHGGWMIAHRANEFAAAQELESGLDSALGESCFFRKRTETGGDRFPFHASSLAIKVEVNQIRRRLAIVPDDIAHQNVDDVIVDWNGFTETSHVQSVATAGAPDYPRFFGSRFFLGGGSRNTSFKAWSTL
jgi:hypothetical protein